MAVLSLSFLVGDAAVRTVLGAVSYGWRGTFYFSSVMASILTVPALLLLSNSPTDKGFGKEHSSPHPSPRGNSNRRISTRSTPKSADGTTVGGAKQSDLKGMVQNKSFVLVCVLSFLFTIIRETFNTYSVLYMQSMGFSAEKASSSSSLFPLFGAFSTVCTGLIVDTVPVRHKGLLVPACSVLLMLPLCCLAFYQPKQLSETAVQVLVSASGFLCIGPYTLFAGAFALDIGTPFQASATASALIDASGYVGAVVIMGLSSLGWSYQVLVVGIEYQGLS